MFFPEIDGVVEKYQFRSDLDLFSKKKRSDLDYPVILGHSITWHPYFLNLFFFFIIFHYHYYYFSISRKPLYISPTPHSFPSIPNAFCYFLHFLFPTLLSLSLWVKLLGGVYKDSPSSFSLVWGFS